jgi:hypothetical protein
MLEDGHHEESGSLGVLIGVQVVVEDDFPLQNIDVSLF